MIERDFVFCVTFFHPRKLKAKKCRTNEPKTKSANALKRHGKKKMEGVSIYIWQGQEIHKEVGDSPFGADELELAVVEGVDLGAQASEQDELSYVEGERAEEGIEGEAGDEDAVEQLDDGGEYEEEQHAVDQEQRAGRALASRNVHGNAKHKYNIFLVSLSARLAEHWFGCVPRCRISAVGSGPRPGWMCLLACSWVSCSV
jgi:hypothetical protein